MAQRGVRDDVPAHKITEEIRILQFDYSCKCLTIDGRRLRVLTLQKAQQQDVELLHSAPAAPAEASPFPLVVGRRFRRRCAQCCRSAIMRLISPMARAGFRSFGQASAQFMIVWQR